MVTNKIIQTNIFRLISFSWLVLLVLLLSCDKVDLVKANEVTTAQMTYVSEISANGGGSIFNGGKTNVSLRGICWSTLAMPTIDDDKTMDGTGDGNFTSVLSNLTPNTTYHVRAYASNSHGTSYGENISFTTLNSDIPILETTEISNRTSTTCVSGGTVIYKGSSDITARGVCWSINNPPSIADNKTVDGTGIGEYVSRVSDLNPHQSYYFRAYATNSHGTAYGDLLLLKAYENSVTDIDGNIYQTVSIGTQIWTVENLKVKHYQNGEPIQNITDNAAWNNTETGAYCNYNNDSVNSETYGRLYNWYAASDQRKLAPEGWRVATYEDYQVLIDFLGGPWEADALLKSGGFSALPGGKRNRDGVFHEIDVTPYFWTSTEYHEGSKWARHLVLDGGVLNIDNLSKNYGFSVRCVRE